MFRNSLLIWLLLSGSLLAQRELVEECPVPIVQLKTTGAGSYGVSTGTVLEDGSILTAVHCIDGEMEVILAEKNIPAEVFRIDFLRDLAILKSETGIKSSVKLAGWELDKNEVVYGYGFTGNKAIHKTRGVWNGSDFVGAAHPVPGESGGPILDASNNVVGVIRGYATVPVEIGRASCRERVLLLV